MNPDRARTSPGGARLSRPRGPARSAALEMSVDLVAARVTLRGQLVATTVHVLRDGLALLQREQHPGWTIDVSGLTSIDDVGVRALSAAYRRAVRHGRWVSVDGASPPLLSVLALLRLDRHVLPGAAPHAQEEDGGTS